ncbi:type II restriction enzyme [Corynebacterium hiratae]|uniref:type II restriction enzyme n=1 Tax=Corynebacterium hiratae TaxID=3139423 RepID=UPI003F6DC527
MLNDAAWDLVYPHIAANIADQGFVVLPAAKLKELSGREPRLMAKHDFSAARPKCFESTVCPCCRFAAMPT